MKHGRPQVYFIDRACRKRPNPTGCRRVLMKELQKTVEEYLKSQDDLEFELGDTLDVKTSIALVLITFLATQSADFLRHNPPLSSFWHVVQVVSAAALIAAGVLAIAELKPRGYIARTEPAEFL